MTEPEPLYRDEDWLRSRYWNDGLKMEAIGEDCGVSKQTIHRWMKKLNISRRSRMST